MKPHYFSYNHTRTNPCSKQCACQSKIGLIVGWFVVLVVWLVVFLVWLLFGCLVSLFWLGCCLVVWLVVSLQFGGWFGGLVCCGLLFGWLVCFLICLFVI